MSTFINEFNDKKSDVMSFLNALAFVDSIATNKHQTLMAMNHSEHSISYMPERNIQQIMRSLSYLVLYNIMEATANGILETLKDTINDEQVHVNQIRKSLFDLHVSGTLKNLENTNKIINTAKEILKNVQNDNIFVFDKFDFNTSGSINFEYMQKIVGKLGCVTTTTVNIVDLIDAMNRAKDHRNKLAHGNWTYSTAGSLLVFNTIENDYNLILTYLSEVLENFDNYLKNKKYLK